MRSARHELVSNVVHLNRSSRLLSKKDLARELSDEPKMGGAPDA
jgi:hypothetical protein